jgi:hypothetical protein
MQQLYIFRNKITYHLLNVDVLKFCATLNYKFMGDTRVRKEYSRGLAADGEM